MLALFNQKLCVVRVCAVETLTRTTREEGVRGMVAVCPVLSLVFCLQTHVSTTEREGSGVQGQGSGVRGFA